ncbi:MAG: hypothetical protein Q8L48_28060 [Archangium sp.]|nr:hypothetical protein [Archangium sp.]
MILRNLTSTEQTLSDGVDVKTVSPLGLVAVSAETGFRLLASSPKVWSSEQPLIPPPPA